MTTLLLAAALVAGQPIARVTGSAPAMVVLQAVDKELVSEVKVTEPRTVTVKEKIKKGVEEVEVDVVKTEMAIVSKKIKYPLEGATFKTADGKVVEPADAVKRLKEPVLVVMASGGRGVDPAYLAVLKPNTLVVLLAPVRPFGIKDVPKDAAPPPVFAPKDGPVKDKR